MTILYPRRCEEKRGANLFLEASINLWRGGRKFRAIFCGWGSMQREITRMAAESGFGQFTEVFDVPFDGMRSVYDRADIVVIPTLRHEGTSLSCAEALYMGKPVITTYVGGLPNLVMSGFNGEVVSPTVTHLTSAIARLLEDESLRREYGARARGMSESLSIQRWRDSVWGLLSSSLLQLETERN